MGIKIKLSPTLTKSPTKYDHTTFFSKSAAYNAMFKAHLMKYKNKNTSKIWKAIVDSENPSPYINLINCFEVIMPPMQIGMPTIIRYFNDNLQLLINAVLSVL